MSDFPEQYDSFAEWRREDPIACMKYLNEKGRDAGMKMNDRPSHAQNGTAARQNERNERNETDANSAGASGQNEQNERNESHANSATPLYPSDFYDCLPTTLRDVVDTYEEDRERAVFMAGALPVLAGMCPHVLLHYGGEWLSLNLNMLLVAPPGSGKGRMRDGRRMGEAADERLMEESRLAREKWEHRLDEEEDAGPKPPFRALFAAGDNSATGLKDDLNANRHAVMFESEIKTVTTAHDQDWGDSRDVLLKCAHNEAIDKNRAGDEEPVRTRHPALSVALSGTPRSFEDIILDAEDGLFSRCNFLYFEGDDEFKNMFSTERHALRDEAISAATDVLDEMRKKLERRDEPLYIKAGERERKMIFEAGKKAFAKAKVSEIGDFFLSSVKRSALTAFRIAGLLRLLRLAEEDKSLDSIHSVEVSARDVHAGLLFAMTSLTHAAYLSGRLRKENRTGGLNVTQKTFFGALPTGEFTTAQAKQIAAGFAFTDRTAANYLDRFAERGMIDDTGHGEWSKPDFASLSFLSFCSFSPTAPASESNEAGCQNESGTSSDTLGAEARVVNGDNGSPSFQRGDRVRTPKFEGTICDDEPVNGRWPVRPDSDVFGEGVRYFDAADIELLS